MTPVPRKRFGQHFLTDRAVLERIVAAIDPLPGQNLVEIGPGAGALTRLLRARGVPLQAVEIDRDLCVQLRQEFAGDGFRLHEGDVLKFDLSLLGPAPRMVGNLPYNISTPILFRIWEDVRDVTDCHFMLQEEVVNRMAAKANEPDYGRLSVMLQARFAVEKLFVVPASAFRPPPKVTSSIVRMLPLPPAAVTIDNSVVFADLVRHAFTQRRKMLRNALKDQVTEHDWSETGIDPSARPENLSVSDFARLANRVASRQGETSMKP
ncbi:MAG: 16S rRNA (adenine(1518)-N(6)/adenine(1519)-N(6))-dimethyltransferase RsmA [Betaproteobacteria bacterium]|nr:16S rRNA (adenine(1518)-N(6)/adenine(1519)-N(6))-dimethyltransferase RsmA [Betaproteobacteria bacterium]